MLSNRRALPKNKENKAFTSGKLSPRAGGLDQKHEFVTVGQEIKTRMTSKLTVPKLKLDFSSNEEPPLTFTSMAQSQTSRMHHHQSSLQHSMGSGMTNLQAARLERKMSRQRDGEDLLHS